MIILPAKPVLTVQDLKEYLNMSRQLRLYHTKQHGFPQPCRRGQYRTADVIAHLRRRGLAVEVV